MHNAAISWPATLPSPLGYPVDVIPWTDLAVIKYGLPWTTPETDGREASAMEFTTGQRSLPVAPVWYV